MKITTDYLEHEYDHGEIIIVSGDYIEKKIEVNLALVVSCGDLEYFHRELQELVRKFAL